MIGKLEENEKFKEWKKDNSDSYLIHVFKMLDKANENELQIGYYDKDDTITTFVIGAEVKIVPKAKIFKKPDTKIMELALDDVKIDFDEALERAKSLQEKEYPKELVINKIIILQKLDIGQVYNITLVTQAFNTLNIKVDSKTGNIIKHEKMSLMDLKAK